MSRAAGAERAGTDGRAVSAAAAAGGERVAGIGGSEESTRTGGREESTRAPGSEESTRAGGRERSGSIVQVTLWNSPYLGNFMTTQTALARAVRERLGLGTHFVLAADAGGQRWVAELEATGATWSTAPASGGRRRAHLEEVLEAHGGVLIHTHFTAMDLAAAAAARAAAIPCVWQIHTGFAGYPLRQRLKDLYKFRHVARGEVARVIVVSEWLRQLMLRRGAPRARIDVAPNPIVVSRLEPLPEKAEARHAFGLEQDAEVLLALGWWPKIKGVDVLLDALEQVCGEHRQLQVLLVGEEQLRAFLRHRWREQPGWLRCSGFVEDARRLYAAADAFVSSSRHEGHSTAIGEALVCGLPVVMSDIPGTASWSEAPALSVFASEDPASLAERLREWLAEPAEDRAAAGRQNRTWALQRNDLDGWCEQMCARYEQLLAPTPKQRDA
jgi:glycosyltransferase involved in cell wall biosynthesis